MRQPDAWAILQWIPHDGSMSHIDTVPACVRRTDRQTDGRTNGFTLGAGIGGAAQLSYWGTTGIS